VRLTYLDLVSFDFASTRGNATQPSPDNGGVAHRDRAFILVCDADSFTYFTYPAAAYRCAFQKFESALDWSGGDGWSDLGHCD
jgi:hypothetical protein